MQCVVYKSLRQFDYYLYVRKEDGLSRLPDGLKQLLGVLEKVIDLDLHARRSLSQAAQQLHAFLMELQSQPEDRGPSRPARLS